MYFVSATVAEGDQTAEQLWDKREATLEHQPDDGPTLTFTFLRRTQEEGGAKVVFMLTADKKHLMILLDHNGAHYRFVGEIRIADRGSLGQIGARPTQKRFTKEARRLIDKNT